MTPSTPKRRHKWERDPDNALNGGQVCARCDLRRQEALGAGVVYRRPAELVFQQRTPVPPCQPSKETR